MNYLTGTWKFITYTHKWYICYHLSASSYFYSINKTFIRVAGVDKREIHDYLLDEFNYIDDPIVGNIKQMCKRLDQIGKDLSLSITFSTKYATEDRRFPKIEYFKNDRGYNQRLVLYIDQVTNKIHPVTDVDAYETYDQCKSCDYATNVKSNMKKHEKRCGKDIPVAVEQIEFGVVDDYIDDLWKGN